MKDWDAFIAEHGVGEYVRTRYIEPLAARSSQPKWERDDLAENIRLFGRSKYVDRLRKRMTKYIESPEAERLRRADEARLRVSGRGPYSAHSWPCDDPFCQPCEDAVKRLLRDVGVLPRKGRAK
jgi:hypothetical protein